MIINKKSREYKNKMQRERRKLTNNYDTNKYEKTFKGFLMRKYRNMQSRVTGVQWRKFHLYGGKELLDRKEFYKWSFSSESLLLLWNNWIKNNYERKLCPTVDRIDPKKGYTLDNMRWITHSENSSLSTRKINNKK